MLVEHYPTDKRFEELLGCVPELSPELKQINSYLEDEKLYQLIWADLAKRRPQTCQTGRNSTPVEVVLRMLVVKRLYGYSYAETERAVRDSLSLRQFCRVYLNDVPDDTTLIRWTQVIQAKTLEKFNQRIIQLAVKRKVTRGRKLRMDGTVVEANITPPSDSHLLADSVRVLARTIVRGQAVLQAAGKKIRSGFEDGTQPARRLARQIGEMLRSQKAEAQRIGRHHYEELLALTEQTITSAVRVEKQLGEQTQRNAQRLAATLTHFVPLAQRVIQQATRRVLQGEQVPATEKIVSIFEEHTNIIRRGKESRPVEYGHKVWLNEVEGGLVSHYRILEGNPSDEQQWKPSLNAHLKTFHQPPRQASGDRALFSEPNQGLAHDLGVKHVILPQPGHRSNARLKHEHQAWFVKGRRWHAGIEGRISVLKRAHNLGRCLAHGLTGFHDWVGWGVIAGNLAVLGRT